ncbi:tetratricopeptide repeat protein [Pseudoduganella plicata]|nr:tetratricopeptide repeat protein [Pseudoduganella plicata]
MSSDIPFSVDDTLAVAIAHHQARRLDDAAQAYREILAQRPYHALANHNLGMLAWQQERAAEGLPFLRQAWSINPDEGQFWLSYGEGLLRAGQPEQAHALLTDARVRGLDGPELRALEARCGAALAELAASRPAAAETDEVVRLYGAGNHAGAEQAVRALIERFPESGMLWGMLGTILQVQGKPALAVLEEAARLAPDDAENLVGLGNAQQDAQQFDAAIATYERALALAPQLAEAHCNLGSAYSAIGELAAAIDSFDQAIGLNGDYLVAHLNLGNCQAALRRFDAAADSYRRALALAPHDVDIAGNLIDVLAALDQHDEAAKLCRAVLDVVPDSAAVWLRHADIQRALGNADEAQAGYLRAEALGGDDLPLLLAIAIGLQLTPRPDDATRLYERVLALVPDHALAHGNLGVILEDRQDFEAAHEHYRIAIAADPQFIDAHHNLGICLHRMGRSAEALAQFHHVLQLQPDYQRAHISISAQLSEQGRLHEAIAACRAGLAVLPGDLELTGNLLFCLSHADDVSAEEIAEEHFRFGAHCAALAGPLPPHTNERAPERVIRLGFVSGDFNNHALANFFMPILEFLHRSARVQLFGYYNKEAHDDATDRMRARFHVWRDIAALRDDAVLSLIRADGIDVLIDLSGHTNRNRLAVFAHKPAPVQATWMGYPGTTGLAAMDYILHDRHTLLPEMAGQFSERFAYLPACAPFQPRADLPDVNALPAYTNGYITYGSFNRINKLRRPVIALWARLLRAQPTARLMLAGMPSNGQYQHLIDWFAEEGIALSRLEFKPRASLCEYFYLHHKVDVCLDTFPYAGGTTTMQALWMGIPLLTLAGDTLAGRSAAGVLSQLNLNAFVAHSFDEFVERGLAVTARLELLSDLRQSLRALLSIAPISRPDVIAAGLEGAVRHMWHRWCAGQAPENFEIEYDLVPMTELEVHARDAARKF